MTVIGIDFGTTTCSVAKWSGDLRQKPVLLEVEPTSPVDKHVMRTAVDMPTGLLRNFKLAVDRSGRGGVVLKRRRPDHHAVQYTYDQMYQCLYAINNDTDYVLEANCVNIPVMGCGDWSEQDLITGLDKLFENIHARVSAQAAADQIVVGLPLGFMDLGRERVINSLIRAGWARKKSEIIIFPEPLVTALQCGLDYRIPNQQRILVADLGGGTLDLCVFDLNAVGGDFHIKVLGQRRCDVAGNRFDQSLLEWIVKCHPYILGEYGVHDAAGINDYTLRDIIEACKINLSNHEQAQIMHTFQSGRTLNITINRNELDTALSKELKYISHEIELLLKSCGINANDVEKIFLAGGSSRMPAFQKIFKSLFKRSELNIQFTGFGMLAQGLALVPQYQDLIERLCESSYAVWDYKNKSIVPVVEAGALITPRTNSIKVPRMSLNVEDSGQPAPLIVFHQQGGEWRPEYHLVIHQVEPGLIDIIPKLDPVLGTTRLELQKGEISIPAQLQHYSDLDGCAPPVVRKGQIARIGDAPTTYFIESIRDIKKNEYVEMAAGFLTRYGISLDQYGITGKQSIKVEQNSELSIMQMGNNESNQPLNLNDLVRYRPFVPLLDIEGIGYAIVSPPETDIYSPDNELKLNIIEAAPTLDLFEGSCEPVVNENYIMEQASEDVEEMYARVKSEMMREMFKRYVLIKTEKCDIYPNKLIKVIDEMSDENLQALCDQAFRISDPTDLVNLMIGKPKPKAVVKSKQSFLHDLFRSRRA